MHLSCNKNRSQCTNLYGSVGVECGVKAHACRTSSGWILFSLDYTHTGQGFCSYSCIVAISCYPMIYSWYDIIWILFSTFAYRAVH